MDNQNNKNESQKQTKYKADEDGFFDCKDKCPQCGSDDLNHYELYKPDDSYLFCIFICKNCGCEAQEAYLINYSHTVIL